MFRLREPNDIPNTRLYTGAHLDSTIDLQILMSLQSSSDEQVTPLFCHPRLNVAETFALILHPSAACSRRLLSDWYSVVCFQPFFITLHGTQQQCPFTPTVL